MTADHDEFVPLVKEWLIAVKDGQPRVAATIRRRAIEEAKWAARNLAKDRGWAVFPCRMPDKTPATPNGFKDAVRDPAAVEALWRSFPGDLVGVATGEASRITGLDVDIKHNEARAWWLRNRHRIPRTKTFRTLSGGAHFYFQCQAWFRICRIPLAKSAVRLRVRQSVRCAWEPAGVS